MEYFHDVLPNNHGLAVYCLCRNCSRNRINRVRPKLPCLLEAIRNAAPEVTRPIKPLVVPCESELDDMQETAADDPQELDVVLGLTSIPSPVAGQETEEIGESEPEFAESEFEPVSEMNELEEPWTL